MLPYIRVKSEPSGRARHLLTQIAAIAALLVPAAIAAQITVGPNVQVSRDRPKMYHSELWGGADLTNPDRLIACSMADDKHVRFYVSHDRGKTWKLTLERKEPRTGTNGDQLCEFGPDGGVYAFWLALSDQGKYSHASSMVVYRSGDGGLTWESDPARLPFVERAGFAADNTQGKYRGRLYITGQAFVQRHLRESLKTIGVFRSADGGRTFSGPANRGDELGTSPQTGSSAVLSDGTLLVPSQTRFTQDKVRRDPKSYGAVVVLRSTDGGETIEPPTWVADYSSEEGLAPVPHLAADAGSAAFKDRAYVVWRDVMEGRPRLLFAYSADSGKTWSAPRQVSDARSQEVTNPITDIGYHTVRVNKDGVVGVVWYDRRDRAGGNQMGFRFAASIDGGDTFLPSVRVNENLGVFREGDATVNSHWTVTGTGTRNGVVLQMGFSPLQNTGETVGLAAGADGTFYPFWVDVRTGVGHIFTAPVTVRGAVVRHGAPALAGLVDVSEHITVSASELALNPQTGALTALVRVKNRSPAPLRGPLKLRLVAIDRSDGIGSMSPSGADNSMNDGGAVWDLTSQLGDGVLAPGEETPGRRLTFTVANLRFVDPDGKHEGFRQASLIFKVLAAEGNR